MSVSISGEISWGSLHYDKVLPELSSSEIRNKRGEMSKVKIQHIKGGINGTTT